MADDFIMTNDVAAGAEPSVLEDILELSLLTIEDRKDRAGRHACERPPARRAVTPQH